MVAFTTGQWVECVVEDNTKLLTKGRFYRVGVDPYNNRCGVYIDEVRGLFDNKLFRPVEWHVGRTYKTTLEGVTATIKSVTDDSVYGLDNRPRFQSGPWQFHNTTGRLASYEDSDALPHLTPYLADEPKKERSRSEQIGDDAANAVETVDAKKAERNDEPSYTDSQRYGYIATDSSWGGRPPMSALREQEGDCVQHRYSDDATSPKKHSPRITESEILTRNRELQACADAIIAKGLELSDVKMAAYTDGLEDAMRFTKLRDSLDASIPVEDLVAWHEHQLKSWHPGQHDHSVHNTILAGLEVARSVYLNCFLINERHVSLCVRCDPTTRKEFAVFSYHFIFPAKPRAVSLAYDLAELSRLAFVENELPYATAARLIVCDLVKEMREVVRAHHARSMRLNETAWKDAQYPAEDYRYRPSAEEDHP